MSDDPEVEPAGVLHGALGVVERSGELAGERRDHVVGRLVVLIVHLHQFKSAHSLDVEDVRIGPVDACRLRRSVIVHHEPVFRGYPGEVLEVLDGELVVPVEEIHLEALHAHFSVVPDDVFEILAEGVVTCPEYDVHPFLLAIINDGLHVYLRDDVEQIVLALDRPALVENDIFQSVFGGEVDVVLIGFGVDSGPEIDPSDVPVVPPVPGYLARLHPGVVSLGRGREVPHEVGSGFGQGAGVRGQGDHPPREGPRAGGLSDVVLAAEHELLDVVVSRRSLQLLRIAREHALEARPGLGVLRLVPSVGEEHSRIRQEV